MIGTIFDQPWKLKHSFDIFDARNVPTTYREASTRLTTFTREFWSSPRTRQQMTPEWPEGTVKYLETKFDELFRELGEHFSQSTILAFRLENQVGEEHVGPANLGERVGVESGALRRDLNNLKWHLRSPTQTSFLAPFAFQSRTTEAWNIVMKWKNEQRRLARETLLARNASDANFFLDITVEELDLSVRTYNGLKNAGLNNIRDILERTETWILNQKHFGRKSLNELKDVLRTMDPILEIGMLAPEDFIKE
jgi:hypothetical protein